MDGISSFSYVHDRTPHVNLRQQLYKHLFVLCLAFLGVFTSFQGVSGLQSTGIADDTESSFLINNIPLLVTYIALVPSSVFLTHIVIRKLGTRWTLIYCQIPYILYVCTFYYPHFVLTVPFGILIGLAGAPLWTASSQYLCCLAERHALLFKSNLYHSYSLFFGLYFMVFLSTGVWGNLIYYLIYMLFSESSSTDGHVISAKCCGLDYDYPAISEDTDTYRDSSVRVRSNLISSYLSIAVVSVIVLTVYMESRDDDNDDEGTSLVSSILQTGSKLDGKQALLIPITIWSGVEQAFMMSIFSESYVVCNFGLRTHGLMMTTYGLTASLSSISFGLLRKFIPMRIILSIAAIVNLVVLGLALSNSQGQLVVHLCLAGWGLAEGIWQPQLSVIYGETFPEDHISAFSHYRLWESLGFILIFSLKLSRVNVAITIYIAIVSLVAGMVGYFVLWWNVRKERHLSICPCPSSNSTKK